VLVGDLLEGVTGAGTSEDYSTLRSVIGPGHSRKKTDAVADSHGQQLGRKCA
jgi:hypothetical protein